jgi:hypothetical protein
VPSDINTTYLLATEDFIKQIQEARTVYANMPKAHLTPENLLASNTQKIGITAYNLDTGDTYHKESITQMSKFTKTLGPDKYASVNSIRKCLANGSTFKGWKFNPTCLP